MKRKPDYDDKLEAYLNQLTPGWGADACECHWYEEDPDKDYDGTCWCCKACYDCDAVRDAALEWARGQE